MRIDHYLGKPAVQNLFALRFGNALFEPLWRRESIANIQITIAESLGVETRGDFYDRTGALRDMVQNHALQLLTMIAMEPPINARRRRDPRREAQGAAVAASRSRPRASAATWCAASTAPARSTASAVPAYPTRSKVPAGSRTETFVALRTEIAELALGRRAVLPAHRQAAGRARRADRRQFPAGAACDLSPAPTAPTSW